jgi:hypothetical protein
MVAVLINRVLNAFYDLTNLISAHLCITMRLSRLKPRETPCFQALLRRSIAFNGGQQGLYRRRRRKLVNPMA